VLFGKSCCWLKFSFIGILGRLYAKSFGRRPGRGDSSLSTLRCATQMTFCLVMNVVRAKPDSLLDNCFLAFNSTQVDVRFADCSTHVGVSGGFAVVVSTERSKNPGDISAETAPCQGVVSQFASMIALLASCQRPPFSRRHLFALQATRCSPGDVSPSQT